MSKEKDSKDLSDFFKHEYQLDYMLYDLQNKGVVTVAFWNGVVMGGGVGLSINAMHKVCTDSTTFAMPESKIGLFCDVGVHYHLSKLP